MTGLVVLCVGCAVWLLMGPSSGAARLAVVPRQRRAGGWGKVALPAAAATALLLLLLPAGRWRTVGVVVLVLAAFAAAWWRRSARHRRANLARADVARGCWELAGEVAAGRVPAEALRVVSEDVDLLRRAAATAALGGEVGATWRRQASEPGCGGLLILARAWEVSLRTGAPLGPPLRAVADQLRETRRLEHTVTAELASTRATGRLLAGLPVAGVVLGFALGGNPATFLLDTFVGECCLVAAVLLAGTGLLWCEHLADKAAA